MYIFIEEIINRNNWERVEEDYNIKDTIITDWPKERINEKNGLST